VRPAPISNFVLTLFGSLLLQGCEGDASDLALTPKMTEADSSRGADLIQSYGCGSCHEVPGVDGAAGVVGPPLQKFGKRVYVAGMVRNTPDNLVSWLKNPQGIVPGNAMPNLGVTDRDARDMAAYLYTLQ
jgi:cytochrome c2